MDKAKLEKLLEFVTELSSLPENEWLRGELLRKMGVKAGDNLVPEPIKQVYEQCIRDIISRHAENFYGRFQIPDKEKKQLISDFTNMENARRDDNFSDFCVKTYQQIEQIVNYAYKFPACSEFIKNNYQLGTYVHKKGRNEVRQGWGIGKFLFGEQADLDNIFKQPSASQKFRMVLFFYGFGGGIPNSSKDWERMKDSFEHLYAGRNTVHRGTELNYNAEKLQNMKNGEHRYYFKFLGFLEEFVYMVNDNLPPLTK
jgi:hypothetical protein